MGPKGEVLKLIDSRFFTNRDGFGFIKKNLKAGKYQIHFKKYSSAFDVFDFTARVYSPRSIKLLDDDDEALKKIQLSKEVMAKIPSIEDHIKDNDKKEESEEKAKEKAVAAIKKK
jgi:putative heme degradation protein